MQVVVELKNDLAVSGTLHSVDQYLNVKLLNTKVINEQKYPHMVSGATFFGHAPSSNRWPSPVHACPGQLARSAWP